MRPEEAPGAGVGGGRLSTAYPQIRARGAKGAPSDPSASSSCDSRTAELPSRGGHRESPHCRFGAGVGGAALSGHPGPGGLRGAGSRAWPVLPPARPVWAAFGDGQAGPGGAAGASPRVPVPGAPSRLHPPCCPDLPRPSPLRFCFYCRRNIAGTGLSFPPRPRWLRGPGGSGLL